MSDHAPGTPPFDLTKAIYDGMEAANKRWAGKTFEEMERTCLKAMRSVPRIQLPDVPRLP